MDGPAPAIQTGALSGFPLAVWTEQEEGIPFDPSFPPLAESSDVFVEPAPHVPIGVPEYVDAPIVEVISGVDARSRSAIR